MYYSFPVFARLAAATRPTPETNEAKPDAAEPVRDDQLLAPPSNPFPLTAIE